MACASELAQAAARAASENLIVFAETGSGKTMVAELAIKAGHRAPLLA